VGPPANVPRDQRAVAMNAKRVAIEYLYFLVSLGFGILVVPWISSFYWMGVKNEMEQKREQLRQKAAPTDPFLELSDADFRIWESYQAEYRQSPVYVLRWDDHYSGWMAALIGKEGGREAMKAWLFINVPYLLLQFVRSVVWAWKMAWRKPREPATPP
jgi:hypothetical protein